MSYIYIRNPPRPDWSPQKLLAIEICNLIPVKRWDSHGMLAEAYNLVVAEQGLDYKRHNPVTFGKLIDDAPWRLSNETEWTCPWHRIRGKDGYCRKKGKKPDIRVLDPNEIGPLRWTEEGGLG